MEFSADVDHLVSSHFKAFLPICFYCYMLSGYKGDDLYSDGSIEDELLDIVSTTSHFEKILAKDNRWPLLYHLSPLRRNLLEWYPFQADSNLLEVGSGCGALTSLFCEKLAQVSCVEMSKKRSEINLRRNRRHTNLRITVGNIMDIDFTSTYAYITLIGVLEYTKSFVAGNRPYTRLLSTLHKLLQDDGRLVVAIENKFGLKYFAGAREDHTNIFFDSIEGYGNSFHRNRIETFGLYELIALFNRNGFAVSELYFPHPDYKLPSCIYNRDFPPDMYTYLEESTAYGSYDYSLFNQHMAMLHIIKNGQFEFFANSFLFFLKKI